MPFTTLQSSLCVLACALLAQASPASASDVDNPFCITSLPLNYLVNAFYPIKDNPAGLTPMPRTKVFVPVTQRTGLSQKRIVMIGDHFGIDGDTPPWASDELRAIFTRADLVLGNLEGPITYNNGYLESDSTMEFNFHQNVAYLQSAMSQYCMDPQKTVFTVANNHAGDGGHWYASSGDPGTVSNSDKLKLLGTAGIDRNTSRTPDVQVFDLGDLRVGLLGWTHLQNTAPREDNANNILYPTWEASKRVLETDFTALKQARGIEFLIGMPHWDCQWHWYPHVATNETADTLHAQGFDLIAGSHPSVLQVAKQLPAAPNNPAAGNDMAFFSLGNFNSSGILANGLAPVVELVVDGHGRTLEYTVHAFVLHKQDTTLRAVNRCGGRTVFDWPRATPWTLVPLDYLLSTGSNTDRNAHSKISEQLDAVFPR